MPSLPSNTIGSLRLHFVGLLLAVLGAFLPAGEAGAQGVRVSPDTLYRGGNIITIEAPGGIEQVSIAASSRIVISEPPVVGLDCPKSVPMRVDVGSMTTDETLVLTIYTCDGRIYPKTLGTENWEVMQEYTGPVEIGRDTCVQCFIRSSDRRILDSIVVRNPNLRVEIPAVRSDLGYVVRQNVPFDYRVCYTSTKPERFTDTIYLYLQRGQKTPGFTDYVIAKPITIHGVDELPDPEPVVVTELQPPLVDPTTFRNIVMPSAESPREGSFYYGNYGIVGSLAGYGIDDKLSVLGGGVFVPEFISKLYLGTIGAKYEFHTDSLLRVAIGGEYALSSTEESDISTVAPYIVGTFGNRQRSATLALGYAFKRHTNQYLTFRRDAAVLGLGGNMEIARGWKLAAEFYMIESSGIAPLLITARKFTDSFAFDFGLGIDLAGGTEGGFTSGLSGEIRKLAIAPYVSAIWVW